MIKTKIILIFFLMASVFLFSGCLKQKSIAYRVDLEIWSLFDENEDFSEIIREYHEINPFIGDIVYKKFTPDSYKKDLVEAMAAGNGPDIFLMHNTWLPGFQNKSISAPAEIFGEKEFRENFADVAVNDFLAEGQVYAVPLSIDSLALYYNKDIFNAAGIVAPPQTWNEFNEMVEKTTKIDNYGNITQSGVAMGTAYNINRSTDVLGLLMFQNGTEMINNRKTDAIFNQASQTSQGYGYVKGGENALEYYTQFASLGSPLYCWNSRQHYSIDAFFEGTAATMLNYSWHRETIKSKNSKLNFAMAPVPQLFPNAPVNYANYWGLAVNKNKRKSDKMEAPAGEKNQITAEQYEQIRIHESWEFLKFLTAKNSGKVVLTNALTGNPKELAVDFDPAENYLEKTKKPAARRDLIEKQKSDPELGAFASGNLIAKNWYQTQPEAIESILAEAIESVILGETSVSHALDTAASRVSQLMK